MANDKTYDRHVNIWINGKEVKNDISSIEKEMRNLTKEYKRATIGSQEHNEKAAELRKVKGILKEHQDNLKETPGLWDKIKGAASSGIGAITLGIGIIMGAYKSLKTVIYSTDELGDKFDKTLAGWQGGINAFARALATINKGGLKNLGENIRKGIEEGRRYAESLDQIDEKTRALQIAEAEASNEILKQTEISRSAKYTKDQQIEAGKKIIELEEKLTAIRSGIGQQAFENEAKNIAQATHLTNEEVLAFVRQDEVMLANIETGKKYTEFLRLVKKEKESQGGSSVAAIAWSSEEIANLKAYREEFANVTEATKRYADAAAKMPGDDKMQLFTDKYIAYQQAIGSGLENTMRTRIRTAKNEDQLNDEAIKGAQKVAKTKKELEIESALLTVQLQSDVQDVIDKTDKEYFENKQKRNEKDLADKKLMEEYTDEYFEKEKKRNLENLENQMVIKANNIFAQIDLEKQKNEVLKRGEIDAAEETGASVQLINEKYAELNNKLDKEKSKAKLQLASEFFNNVATISGRQTAIGKAAAIAETTINTYSSATASYKALAGIPIIGPALGFVAAAAAVAAGLDNVKQILKVGTDKKGYYIGGYTGAGGKYEPAGIVHRGEWIANADMVSSPTYGPIIQAMEYDRVNGRSGYANGGGPRMSSSGSGAAGSSPALISTDPELKYLIKQNSMLLAKLDRDGVKNNWPWTDVDNMRKGMTKLEEIEAEVTM